MKYKNFLFDLDGTLINTTELIVASFLHTLKWGADLTIERQGITELIGRPLYDQLKAHLGDREDVDYEKLMEEHMRYQVDNWEGSVVVFDGVADLLKRIKDNGGKMAIVTSRKEKTAKLYTEKLNIAQYFDLIVTPEFTEKHKPDKEPALYAMKKLNFKKEETVFIGDSVFDMQCANASGLDNIFVAWGSGKKKEIENIKVKYIFDKVKEFDIIFNK